MTSPPVLPAGLRILVVEDEMMVAMLVEDMVAELGMAVVGPAARVAHALDLLAVGPVDLGILDVNLGGEKVFAVADALAARGIPFLFATGYGRAGLPEGHRERPVLQKPFTPAELEAAILRACAARGAPPQASGIT